MLFNSTDFLYFFLITVGAFFLLPKEQRWIVLLLSSIVFYAWAKPVYVALLGITTLSTWYASAWIDHAGDMKSRRTRMRMVVIFNLLILVVFKYLGFFNELIGIASRLTSGHIHFSFPELALPVGISFYTFQSIGYVLDVYYKIRKPEPHLGHYAVFVSFFPQILSGPIGRSTELLPQIKNSTTISWVDIEYGAGRFIWGLFKKIVIADRLNLIVNDVYDHPSSHYGLVLLFVSVLYSFQLYADFSGYTDMAIGVARILGIRLAENFDFPYISKNVTEFWRRWHLSLSNWLRDYLYTPILFSKKKWGKKAVVYAIFLTFMICGIWHGAKLTFVIFGVLQVSALTWDMLSKNLRASWAKKIPSPIYNFLSWGMTFFFIVFCFIFFRADTTPDALLIAKRMLTTFTNYHDLIGFIASENASKLAFTLMLVIIFFVSDRRITGFVTKEGKDVNYMRPVVWGVLLAIILVFGTFGRADFIYFRF